MKKEIEVGKPLTADDLLSFELPPVSETANDFIEAEPPANEPEQSDFNSDVTGRQDTGDTVYITSSTKPEAEAHRGRLSDSGDIYDPAIHHFPPTQTGKTKRWRKKSRRQIDEEKQTRNDMPDEGLIIRRNAEEAAYLYGHSHQLIYGEHGQVENADDLLPLMNALERYMQQNGSIDTPPLVSVIINAGAYSARVARREANKEKTSAIVQRVKDGFNWALVKLGLRKRKENREAVTSKGNTSKTYEPLNAGQ